MILQDQAKSVAKLLRVLSNENRLLVLCALIDEPQTVGRLLEKTPGISQSALSQHLTLLKAHGLVDSQKSGQNITYRIADPRLEEIIAVLKKNYCAVR